VTVFEEGTLKFSSVIPIGWDSVTNDIALGLRTSTWVAEKLKLDYAELGLESKEWYSDKEIDLNELNIGEEGSLSPLYLSQIVTARYEEIFYFVREELRKVWKDGMLPEWAVCVWWWTKIKWFVALGRKNLKLPAFIWLPKKDEWYSDASVNDPVFASVLWTLILANKYSGPPKIFALNIGWFFSSITWIFKKILP
jgi:cell division protein FtsA